MTAQTEYPPLTPLDDYPLHPEGIYSPEYIWACSAPERPRDAQTAYDWRCHDCVRAAEMHITLHGDDETEWTRTRGAEPIWRRLSWMVARSRWWFDREAGR